MPDLGIFELNQHPRNCLITKFCEKMKMSKFGIKNTLFEYFWARVLNKLLPYFKSAPSNLPNSKIFEKTKNA